MARRREGARVLWLALAVGCGAAEPAPAEPTSNASTGAELDEELGDDWEETPAEPDRARAPVAANEPTPAARSRPASRVTAHDVPTVPELSAADALAAAAAAVPIGLTTPAPDVSTGVRLLVAQVTQAMRAVEAAVTAYEAVALDSALPPEVRATARVRAADARDALAARLETASFPVTGDMADWMATATPEARARFEAQVLERVREELAERIGVDLSCAALFGYRAAEPLAPAGSWAAARIAEQLTAYGAGFASTCESRDP